MHGGADNEVMQICIDDRIFDPMLDAAIGGRLGSKTLSTALGFMGNYFREFIGFEEVLLCYDCKQRTQLSAVWLSTLYSMFLPA